jgi:hypothetical protein
MSYKLKIGKGFYTKTRSMQIGTLETDLRQNYGSLTINKLAKTLANQFDIQNGEIELISVEFICSKAVEPK